MEGLPARPLRVPGSLLLNGCDDTLGRSDSLRLLGSGDEEMQA